MLSCAVYQQSYCKARAGDKCFQIAARQILKRESPSKYQRVILQLVFFPLKPINNGNSRLSDSKFKMESGLLLWIFFSFILIQIQKVCRNAFSGFPLLSENVCFPVCSASRFFPDLHRGHRHKSNLQIKFPRAQETQNLYPEPTWIWKTPSCSRSNNLRGFRTNRYDKTINKQPRATIAQETFKLCYTRQYPVSVLYHCLLIKMLLLHDSLLTFIDSICLKAFSSVWVVKKKVVDENKWTSVAIAYHRQNTTCSNCCCYSTLNNMNAHMANLSMLHWIFVLCLFWHSGIYYPCFQGLAVKHCKHISEARAHGEWWPMVTDHISSNLSIFVNKFLQGVTNK